MFRPIKLKKSHNSLNFFTFRWILQSGMQEKPLFTTSFLLEVIQEAPYGVVVFNDEGNILLDNGLSRGVLNENKSLIGSSISTYFEQHELIEYLNEVLDGVRANFDVMETNYLDKVMTIRCRKLEESNILTVQDITQWKQGEMYSVQSVLNTLEEDRNRIALELHDSVGSQISANIHQLEAVIEKLKSNDNFIKDEIRAVVQSSKEVSEELRSISHTLIPRVLIDFGIVAALQSLVNKINTGNKCKVELINSFSGVDLDQEIELNLYRITQELLSNALKHANADHIFVQLVKSDQRLVLMIEDNGSGFDFDKLRLSEGIGLSNVETRTKVLGGELNIESAPGRGTVIMIEVPLDDD